MMKRTVETFTGRLGDIAVTAYTEGGHTEYQVEHTHPAIQSYWTAELFEAMRHARFLASKY